MADLGFFDALALGAVLLGAVFVAVYVGFFLVPAFWIVFVCGWPAIVAIAAVYATLRRSSRDAVMRGREPLFGRTPTNKYCPACFAVLDVGAGDCPMCGFRLLPTYPATRAIPRFCLICGTPLEHASRYRRGWCPRCREYR